MPCTQTLNDYFSYLFRHTWPLLFDENGMRMLRKVSELYNKEIADQVIFSVPLHSAAGACGILFPQSGSEVPQSWCALLAQGSGLTRPLPRWDAAALKSADALAEACCEKLASDAAWAAPLLERCREAQSAALSQFGQSENGLLVLTAPMMPEKVPEYLQSIGWPGDLAAVRALLAAIAPQMKANCLSLEIALSPQGVQPGLAIRIDAIFGWGRRLLERWLEFLQQQGLCTPAKAQGVQGWFDMLPQYMPMVQCNISHFRLILPESGAPQAECGLRLSQQPTRNDYDHLDTPVTMNLELTTRCPLHCPQCYCDLTHGQDLDVNEALYWIEEGHKNGVHMVNLSGGETMVYPHLLTLIRACAERGMQANIAISGYGITRNVLQRLIEVGVGGIFVSLNGSTKEIGSKSRDGYDLAIHALELLRDLDFDGVHINWVMHNNNADDFANMLKLCEKYKVPSLSVMVFKPDSSHQLPSAPTGAQIRAVAETIRAYKGPVHFDIEGCFSQMRALVYQGFLGNLNQGIGRGCMAGTAAISINVNGKITPCRHLEISEETRTIREYWLHSPTLQALRAAAHEPHEPCQSCKLQKNCLPCMAFNHKLHGRIKYGTRECPLAE